MKWFSLFLIALFFCTPGCELKQREAELEKREAALNQKEQELIVKEKTLQIKEQELLQREQKMDSTLKADTLRQYNPALTGTWQVKMTCTETTCPGSAIGDVKTEQWNISYQATTVLVKAMTGDKLVRIYTGSFNGNTVELVEDKATKKSFAAARKVGARLYQECAKRGLVSRIKEDIYMLAPAFVISDADLDACVNILGEAIPIAVNA